MSSLIRRWFLGIIVLITAAAVISYLILVVGMTSALAESRAGNWLVIAALLALSIGLTNLIWNRLDRSTRTMTKQLQAMESEENARLLGLNEDFLDQTIEPDLDRSLAATRDRMNALRREREELELQKALVDNRRNHLQAILYSIPEAVIVTDAFDQVILANGPAQKMFDFTLSAGQHKPLQECIHDKELLRLLEETTRSSNRTVAQYSRNGSGGRRWYDVILSVITDQKKDQSMGVLAILHDVTREREAARMKTDFVSSVSHELRTPLASIRAYLEMLMDGEVEDDQTRHKFYEVIQNEAYRLSNLVDNILNISRIEAGVVKVSKENVPLAAVVKEILEVLRPQAQASDIKLIDELSPIFFHVRADREMMRQAVFNLVSNALKYTPQGGTVTVRLSVDEADKEVTTEITDTGVGIDAASLPRIFDKFYRVSGSKEMAKGTGLGLALVKEIVETVHDGRLSVKSSPGQGSTFAFSMPLAQ